VQSSAETENRLLDSTEELEAPHNKRNKEQRTEKEFQSIKNCVFHNT